MIKYIIFSFFILNFVWFDIYHTDITGVEFFRNWITSFALTFPILTIKRKRVTYLWAFALLVYLNLKWTSLFGDLNTLYYIGLYELTLFFVLIVSFQKWKNILISYGHKLTQLKLVKYFWIILILDLAIGLPLSLSPKFYHNPIRDMALLGLSYKNQNQKKDLVEINFKISGDETNVFFIELPFFTFDFFKSFDLDKKTLKKEWQMKKNFLLPNEVLNLHTFFLKNEENVNYTVGKTDFLKSQKSIKHSSVTPDEEIIFNDKNKIRAIYTIAQDSKVKIKRLYGKLESTFLSDQHWSGNISTGFHQLQLLTNFIKKLDEQFPKKKFKIFILGGRSKGQHNQSIRFSILLKPFYLITNETNSQMNTYLPSLNAANRELISWEENIKITRKENKLTINSIFGVFNHLDMDILLDR